jgi:hypothetical protein
LSFNAFRSFGTFIGEVKPIFRIPLGVKLYTNGFGGTSFTCFSSSSPTNRDDSKMVVTLVYTDPDSVMTARGS